MREHAVPESEHRAAPCSSATPRKLATPRRARARDGGVGYWRITTFEVHAGVWLPRGPVRFGSWPGSHTAAKLGSPAGTVPSALSVTAANHSCGLVVSDVEPASDSP